jgi:enoyl-CoA hydratase
MTLRVEVQDAVTTVILDRPSVRNAVDAATAHELQDAFSAFERDPNASVAVLCGAGGTFSAGYDLNVVSAGSLEDIYQPEGDGPLGISRTVLDKPVIAAIDGYAVAGGLELALWCDLRVMEEDAQVGVFCRRWGVPLVDGGTVHLPRLIGMSRALDLILTGRPVGAHEALAMGLCNRVVPHGDGRKEAERLAHEISRFPQICLRSDRRSAYEQGDLPSWRRSTTRGGWVRSRSCARRRQARRGFAPARNRGGSFT